MLPLLLTLSALAANVVEVDDGHLASVGERLGDATVQQVLQHPEFERITVALPSGVELPLEVTISRPETSPACVAHELAVYPRFELIGGTILSEAGPATDALCERLAQRGEDLPIGLVVMDESEDDDAPTTASGRAGRLVIQIPGPGAQPLRPLHLLLAALLLAVAAALPALRRGAAPSPWLDGVGVGLFGLVARLALSPRGLQIAPDAGFERIVQAWGINQPHPLYGDGYTALHAPLQWLSGWDPATIFGLHLGLSALAPPLLWLLAWLCLRERWGALTAGLGLALLPVALRLAGSEVAHVPLATFELLAVTAAVAFLLRPGLALATVAALAAGFAVHLRPEALPAAALPLALLLAGAWRGRSDRRAVGGGVLAALLLAGLVLARLSSLPQLDGQGPVQPELFLSAELWRGAITPQLQPLSQRQGPFQVFLDLHSTPAILPLLALIGLTAGLRRHHRVVGFAVAWWALVLLPILPKAYPLVDAWRLQLAGQAPLLLLAAVGVTALPRWRLLAPLAVALSAPGYASFVRQPWAGMVEWRFMAEALEELPGDATVLFPDHEVHAAKLAQVGALLNRRAGDPTPWWQPMSTFAAAPEPGPDLYAWIGLTCRIAELPGRHVANDLDINPCLRLAEVCQLTPWAVTILPEQTDLDLSWLATPVEVGLYRVDGCGGDATP